MNPEKAGFSRDRLQRVSQMLQGYVERRELAGISALISRNGTTAYREKFGWQNIEAGKPLAFDTLFRIMSMTKPVTAVAAMLFYEEGYFRFEHPDSRYPASFFGNGGISRL